MIKFFDYFIKIKTYILKYYYIHIETLKLFDHDMQQNIRF